MDGTDDEAVVWDLGGRLLLPADFAAPPARLAPLAELAAAARAAPVMTRLGAFVDWVNRGRTLGSDGELTKAQTTELIGLLGGDEPHPSDEPELDRLALEASAWLVWPWAELADLVEVRGTRLVRTRTSRQIDADPLTIWYAVFQSRLEIGVVDVNGNGPPWGQDVEEAVADLVCWPTSGTSRCRS